MKKRNETIARFAMTIYLFFVFFIFFTKDYANGYVEYNNGQDLSLEKFLLTVPVFVIALAINLVITRFWNDSISRKFQNQQSSIHQLPKTLHYLYRISINLLAIFISVFFKDIVFKVQPILYAPMFIIFNLSLMIKIGYDYPKYNSDASPFDDPKLMFEEYQELMTHLSNHGKLEDFKFKSSLISSFNYNNSYQEEYLYYALIQAFLNNNANELCDLIDKACMTDRSEDINEHLIIELQSLKGLILGHIDKDQYSIQNTYFSQVKPTELSILINFYCSETEEEYLRNFIKDRNALGWNPINTSLRIHMEQYERTEPIC